MVGGYVQYVVSVAGTELERRILYHFGSLSLSSSDKRLQDRDLMKVSISAGLESAPQKVPSVVLIGRLSFVIVWSFHRQVL